MAPTLASPATTSVSLAAPEAKPPARIAALDGLRAVAFLGVFLHHAVDAPLLWMGVDLFFVMSGFLITGSLIDLKKRGAVGAYFKTFYQRRLLRIVPPYYLVLLVFFLTVLRGSLGEWPWFVFFVSNFRDASHRALLAPAVHPMWSLAVEEQFYLVWPLVVLLLPRRPMVWFTASLLVVAPACRALVNTLDLSPIAVFRLTPCRIDLLAAGALLTVAWRTRRDILVGWRGPALVASAASAAALFALVLGVPTFRVMQRSMLFDVVGYSLCLVTVTGVFLYVITAAPGALVHRALTRRVPVLLGTVSYGMYLIHQAILTAFHTRVAGPRPLLGVAAYAVTFALAWASWTFLERPLLRVGQPPRPAPEAAVPPR